MMVWRYMEGHDPNTGAAHIEWKRQRSNFPPTGTRKDTVLLAPLF